MTTALEGGEGSATRPGRSLPPRKTRYPLYRRLVGPQGRSGQVRNISPPPGFDPRTVQPVASRYTDYARGWNEICALSTQFHVLYIRFLGGKASGRRSMIRPHISPGRGFVCHPTIIVYSISITFSSINPDEQRVQESTKIMKSC